MNVLVGGFGGLIMIHFRNHSSEYVQLTDEDVRVCFCTPVNTLLCMDGYLSGMLCYL